LLALAFGKSIGNVFDPRALFHLLVSVVLVIFSAITVRRSRVSEHLTYSRETD
jgi:hypothetical protein